ncbi:hypothetical protein [Acinetobacter haemolyticus]|uniref:hypothetical protein n=1 Tax=Acinetobacter haemolyticus TaxID=29430 RepID=UPI0021CD9E10|nr:hypothetical protein [Acinetobacter haemolyticus]MCU4378851.1 hypothetical protein [Acinetobacter haemolyticus]
MSKLVNAFLSTVGKTAMQVIEVPEIGRVGVRTSMLLNERAAYFAERKDNDGIANALMLKKTVCDPDTGELILGELSLDQINQLPTHVTDPMVKVALAAIGVTKEMLEEKIKEEPKELKNSENGQN